MDNEFISKKKLIGFCLLSVLIVIVLFFSFYIDTRSKIVFCDVGQGDAAYIRLTEGIDILIDAGPSEAVLSCLGRQMPFWDRKVEMAFLSHSQADHYWGFLEVAQRYHIDNFFISGIGSNAKSYHKLIDILRKRRTKISMIYKGDRIEIADNIYMSVLWPCEKYISDKLKFAKNSLEIENNILGLMENTENENAFSQILLFSSGSTDILLTGDTTHEIQAMLLSEIDNLKETTFDKKIEILKVPHHGAKNGLLSDFLAELKPEIGIISVGKNNSFGHPADKIIKLLEDSEVKIFKTSDQGDIVMRF